MKKYLIIGLICAPFIFAYYHKPPFAVHQEKIYHGIMGTDAEFDEAARNLPQWDKLEFDDWFIFTATRDKENYSIVSFGLLDRAYVADSDWGPKVLHLKPEQSVH